MCDLLGTPMNPQLDSFRFRIVLAIGLVACGVSGCNRMRQTPNEDRAAREENGKISAKSDKEVQDERPRIDAVEKLSEKELRQQLDAYLSKFTDEVDWKYGEREAGALAGTWKSSDANGRDVVFWEDGRFGEDFAGEQARGIYAVSEGGRVATVSQTNTGLISSHFRIDGDRLIGPDGPLPAVIWQRTGPPGDY